MNQTIRTCGERPSGSWHYTLNDVTNAKGRGLEFCNFVTADVLSEGLLKHLPLVATETECLEESRLVLAIRVHVGQ